MSATERSSPPSAAGRPSESRPDPANANHSRSSYPASATPRLGRAVSSSSAGAAVVSAPAEVQRARVLARPGMTEAAFAAILAKQLPDAEKRARADYVIDTGRGFPAAEAAVARIVADLTARPPVAPARGKA